MEEDSYNFATTILTSKSPEQAAAILPSIITGSTGLNKDLSSWFNNYNSAIGAHNANLRQLLEEAKKIAGRSSVGFNNFPRNWNCLVNAVQMELKDNEILQENLKQDVIIPLKNLVENDVRISELTINGQELTELSQHLTKEGEYQWNFKAPQAFQNLEAFKKIEIQLMFNVILNYFQLNNARLNKEVKNNENSTNYLLGSFKLDNEMKSQLDYMQNTQFQLPQQIANQNRSGTTGSNSAAGSSTTPAKERRRSSFGRLDKHAGAHDETSPKKSSKLKSRVGSIFGRKRRRISIIHNLNLLLLKMHPFPLMHQPHDQHHCRGTTPQDLSLVESKDMSRLPQINAVHPMLVKLFINMSNNCKLHSLL